MALTKTPIELSSTPGIVDNSNATAITIDSSENVTFAGPIQLTAGALAAAGNASLSHRSSDNKVYLQAGTGGFNILDDQQNTHFSIDSAGVSTFNNNVGIGGTTYEGSVTSNASSVWISSAGYLSANINNDWGLGVNRTGTDGTLINLRKNGAEVGSIGVYSGVPYIGYQGGAGGGIMFNGKSIEPTALGSSRTNGQNDIGSSTYRWKDLYLSGGAYLGGTGAANHLDDYEEGTWSPNIIRNGGSIAATFTAYNSTYVKIGNIVYVKTFIHTMSNGSSDGTSYWRINGMPFAGSVEQYTGIALGYNSSPADNCYVGDAGGNAILCIGSSPYTGAISGAFMLAFTYKVN